MAKLIFINLPVSDLVRATAFYQAIGAVKNAQFSDDTASRRGRPPAPKKIRRPLPHRVAKTGAHP